MYSDVSIGSSRRAHRKSMKVDSGETHWFSRRWFPFGFLFGVTLLLIGFVSRCRLLFFFCILRDFFIFRFSFVVRNGHIGGLLFLSMRFLLSFRRFPVFVVTITSNRRFAFPRKGVRSIERSRRITWKLSFRVSRCVHRIFSCVSLELFRCSEWDHAYRWWTLLPRAHAWVSSSSCQPTDGLSRKVLAIRRHWEDSSFVRRILDVSLVPSVVVHLPCGVDLPLPAFVSRVVSVVLRLVCVESTVLLRLSFSPVADDSSIETRDLNIAELLAKLDSSPADVGRRVHPATWRF